MIANITPGNVNNVENIKSMDYETLARRFECFVGPNYDYGEIESGIDRITFIEPPYNEEGIKQINDKMFEVSNDREGLANIWKDNCSDKTVIENRIPKSLQVPPFSLSSIIILLTLFFVNLSLLFLLFKPIYMGNYKILDVIVLSIFVIVVTSMMIRVSKFPLKHLTPAKSFKSLSKAVLKTFKKIGIIEKQARIKVKEEKEYVRMWLGKSSIREQNLFNTAIEELLKPLENPRYIIVKCSLLTYYDYRYSFSCPSSYPTAAPHQKSGW